MLYASTHTFFSPNYSSYSSLFHIRCDDDDGGGWGGGGEYTHFALVPLTFLKCHQQDWYLF